MTILLNKFTIFYNILFAHLKITYFYFYFFILILQIYFKLVYKKICKKNL
jgi:hypothetical protein